MCITLLLCYAVLFCAVLCCAVLCCAVLCCVVLCCAVLHCVVLCVRVDGSLSVKVAVFGLTRDISKTDYYRQSHPGKVPVKWMPPESLHDLISNQKTDVVS